MYLLDDVLLEIDAQKRSKFLKILPKSHQSFFTFLPDEKTPNHFSKNKKTFTVNNGIIIDEEK